MPLPPDGTEWPLPEHAAINRELTEHDAWYSGDPDRLTAAYAGARGATARPITRVRPSQYAGGLSGAVSRWWWGSPPAEGEQRTKLHVPLASDLCTLSADLLFGEPVTITVGDGEQADKDTETAVQTLRDAGLDMRLREGAEVTAALGRSFLRTRWDNQTADAPWLEVIHADGAWADYRHGRVEAITLWQRQSDLTKSGGIVYRLLERHEVGRIEYRLYAGTATNLGKSVPLQDHEDTADLADLVNAEGYQDTNLDRMAVAYWPNVLPNKKHRRSYAGRSDLQGVEPLLDALDEAYSSWWRDIRIGKGRIFVPNSYLETDGPGQGSVFDQDREVYVPVNALNRASDGLGIQVEQFKIRYQEHAETCREWRDLIIQGAGYSVASMGDSDGSVITATEVRSREKRSYGSRDKKASYATWALNQAIPTLLEAARKHHGIRCNPDAVRVSFPDGVQDAPSELAQTALALRNAEAASAEVRVRMVHPDWTPEQVTTEVAAILAESGAGAPVAVPDDAGF